MVNQGCPPARSILLSPGSTRARPTIDGYRKHPLPIAIFKNTTRKQVLIVFFLYLAFFGPATVYGQLYSTRTGCIGVYAKTTVDIAVLLKGFTFTTELMQEHLNENYVESHKYPKASFHGSYTGDVPPG